MLHGVQQCNPTTVNLVLPEGIVTNGQQIQITTEHLLLICFETSYTVGKVHWDLMWHLKQVTLQGEWLLHGQRGGPDLEDNQICI